MEDWLYYSLALAFCVALSCLLSSLRQPAAGKPPPAAATTPPPLPPGPTALTAFGPLLMLAWTSVNIESVVRVARSWYGPVFTLYILPSFPVVFVADRDVARRVLVQRGSAFADRPPANLATRIFSSDQHNITAGAYGPLWRALRSNLTAKVLHPECVRQFAPARRRAASGLVAGITQQMKHGGDGTGVVILELLHQAVFHVLISMCFGEGLPDGAIASVAALQREFLIAVVGFQVFGACPAVTKLLFRRRYNRMLATRRQQEELFIPLIRARRARLHDHGHAADDDAAAGEEVDYCYVDSLLGLRVPEDGGKRNLTEMEMVSLCTEFLSGPVDSTVTVLQWAMANLVAQPGIQAKLRAEIRHVAGAASIQDEHLQRMPYLRAVVLEALRRHPPSRFILPHAASEDGGGTLDGFSVPRHTSVNFTLGFMAMDKAVWRNPEQFRPERFLPGGEGEDVDLTGNKEIKMMPFGAGRRMCPAMDVSLLHLEYFVANMVREFEWAEVPGEPVDFADKLELTMVMRRPLRAKVVPCG